MPFHTKRIDIHWKNSYSALYKCLKRNLSQLQRQLQAINASREAAKQARAKLNA